MTPRDLIARAERHGVQLELRGANRVHWKAPTEPPPELLEQLKSRKPELLRLLRNRQTVASILQAEAAEPRIWADDMLALPLADFAESYAVVVVWSRLLGGRVVVAADNAAIDPEVEREEVVYRAAELAQLIGLGAGSLRRVHEVKQIFGATVEAN